MRADARRNRERLLAVADAVFAEQGTGASTEEVARRAGVGIGTVFRHFPTKEALLEAVLGARLDRLLDRAEQLTAAEPGPALAGFLDAVVELADAKHALSDALAATGVDGHTVAAPARARLRDLAATLLTRAQAAGAVRPDLTPQELMVVASATARAAGQTAHDPVLRSRTVALLTAGLRIMEP